MALPAVQPGRPHPLGAQPQPGGVNFSVYASDARRIELGVLDELKEIEGLTPAMLVALGEAGLKSVEDLAGCDTDELIGWTERKAGGAVKHKGAFTDLEVSAEEANDLIMKARIHAGWIEAPVEPEASEEEGEVEA